MFFITVQFKICQYFNYNSKSLFTSDLIGLSISLKKQTSEKCDEMKPNGYHRIAKRYVTAEDGPKMADKYFNDE